MKTFTKLVLSLTTVCAATLASAQSFPSKPVHIVVPFPAGGTTDILARELAERLRVTWNTPVIVDNKAGASGTIGSDDVVQSKPDGYTLLLTATHHVINPSIRSNLPYDTQKDFVPLALVGTVPNGLIVNNDFAAKTIGDLIRMAKEKPGTINFASTGIGGANHLSGELFKTMAGIDITHVPYKGAAPALTDLMGGHVAVMFDGMPGVLRAVASGRARVLGVTSLKRVPELPNVPTIDESGVKGFEVLSWFGLYAPAHLPPEVSTRITTDVNTALQSDEIKESFAKVGVEPGTMTQPEFAKYVDDEIAKWSRVVEVAKIPKQ